jgi:alkanesulfonate monooxygenase SsuD/methylene tetrahydromethanopterin reductase-like flavin-dependent oxidoreductase (luciferase family)
MHTGIYFDMRNPPPWATDPTRLYGFTLELCEEADRLGCHSVWFTEHHRFDDGYLPQPLTIAAAVAARTRRIRIGTGIVIAPLHHAVELAEQAAVVDIISGGRLELGLGAGYRIPEFDLFGADIRTRYETTDGRVTELRRLWDGIITPEPVQHPLPLWLGYQGPKGAARAGRLGTGLLSVDARRWPPYRDALVASGHDPAQGRMAGGINAWVSEDPERDWVTVAPHVSYQFDSYRRHMVEGTDQPVPGPVDPNRLRRRNLADGPLGYFTIGTPQEIATTVRGITAGAPVETAYFWASVAGMPEDRVAAHVRTICTQLAPALAEHNPIGAVA